ncbi:MAG: hypothetical protein HXY49_03235 [Ignavibacteriaceae bacterium]|nr:hypothetical protein [Ignavibacteriaceae bacterium]
MKKTDQIIKYLDGSLDFNERDEFEKELNSSEELKSEYEQLKSKLNFLKTIKNPELDERYFSNQIYQLRNKLKPQKSFSLKKYIIEYSSAIAVLLIAVLVFVFNSRFQNEKTEKLISLEIEEIQGTELSEVIKENFTTDEIIEINPEKSDSVIDEMIIEELNGLTDFPDNAISLSINDLDDLYAELNPQEMEMIYSTMINKNIIDR